MGSSVPSRVASSARGQALKEPFNPSLSDLFSAGTITLELASVYPFSDNKLASDGWYAMLDVQRICPLLWPQDVDILDALTHAIQHRYAVATLKITGDSRILIVRIYIVPNDLPGARCGINRSKEYRDRKVFRTLLEQVNKSSLLWKGVYSSERGDDMEMFMAHDGQDKKSFAQIFSELTTTGPADIPPDIPGLRSTLYEYQCESVSTMLDREERSQFIDDPLYIPIVGLEGEKHYMQPFTLEFLRDCPQLAQTRGGFLCEELGTGKTVMMLALILLTLNTLPKPPEGTALYRSGEPLILTPLAFRHFPHIDYKLARESDPRKNAFKDVHRLPTLVETLCHYLRTSPDKVDIRTFMEELEERQLWEPLRCNTPFYFQSENDWSAYSRRRSTAPPRMMYLSSATLIIVPKTLSTQWNSEILKHCASTIRLLVIKGKTKIPPPQQLASDYDIILVKESRISEESSRRGLSVVSAGYTCHCQTFAHIRVPDCHCEQPKDVSPFLQVHWKRIVRDEGHNAASGSTSLNHFLKLVSAERRWIVTGTPTTNLLGLNLGANTGSIENALAVSPLSATSESTSSIAEIDGEQRQLHVWTKPEREDLYKLGLMMANFLAIPRFAADPDAFHLQVTDPLFEKDGPQAGAVQVLVQVMKAFMIRHRIKDVEKDVALPPLTEETVLLDLDNYGQLTYNVLLALVAVNAVDSERKDQDYLFHPMRTAQLASTIENLSHSLFWRVDEYDLDTDLPDACTRAQNAIKHALERRQPAEDIHLAELALTHLTHALMNIRYRMIQHGLEVPYRMHNVPPHAQQSWGILYDYAGHGEQICLMYPSHAVQLRDAIERQPLISETRLDGIAWLVKDKERKLSAFVEARKSSMKSKDKHDKKNTKRKRTEEAEMDKMIMSQVRKKVDTQERFKEAQEEFKLALERLKAIGEQEELLSSGHPQPGPSLAALPINKNRDTQPSQLLKQSPFVETKIGNSASSKLNYILNEVHLYASAEKILIFSNQPFNLVHIAEGLELMGVKFLQFTSGESAERRDQDLTTFETSETYRVFLMELKYGARGLNIVSASRVIFCEPVWQADVESQAIKRVHRIGQTRPVTVKTLAIRSTFEEHMLRRRMEFKELSAKPPGLMEDPMGIRYYLQNPEFLEATPRNEVKLNIPFLRIRGSNDEAEDLLQVGEAGIVIDSGFPADPPPGGTSCSSNDLTKPFKKRKNIVAFKLD